MNAWPSIGHTKNDERKTIAVGRFSNPAGGVMFCFANIKNRKGRAMGFEYFITPENPRPREMTGEVVEAWNREASRRRVASKFFLPAVGASLIAAKVWKAREIWYSRFLFLFGDENGSLDLEHERIAVLGLREAAEIAELFEVKEIKKAALMILEVENENLRDDLKDCAGQFIVSEFNV